MIVIFVTTYCCTLQASHIKRALRRLRPDFSEMCLASSGGRSRPSFLQIDVRTLQTWQEKKKVKVLSWPWLFNVTLSDDYYLQSKPHHLHLTSSVLGRGTLTARQRLWIGPMTLEVEVEQRMRRQVAMYFSIVRRKACWASFVSLSTSVSTTTEDKKCADYYKSDCLILLLGKQVIGEITVLKHGRAFSLKFGFPTFELSLGAWLDLLRLSHSFNQLLNHHTVLVSSITLQHRTEILKVQLKMITFCLPAIAYIHTTFIWAKVHC